MAQRYTSQVFRSFNASLILVVVILGFVSLAASDALLSIYDISKIKAKMEKIRKMTDTEKLARKVYAVRQGAPVSWSTAYSHIYTNYMLGNTASQNIWEPQANDRRGCWIQVSTFTPQYWISIITQGRKDLNFWITTVRIAYTLNGLNWKYVDDGAIFNANSDRNSRVLIEFRNPVFAKTIRIYPQTWNGDYPALSFDAIYLDFPS